MSKQNKAQLNKLVLEQVENKKRDEAQLNAEKKLEQSDKANYDEFESQIHADEEETMNDEMIGKKSNSKKKPKQQKVERKIVRESALMKSNKEQQLVHLFVCKLCSKYTILFINFGRNFALYDLSRVQGETAEDPEINGIERIKNSISRSFFPQNALISSRGLTSSPAKLDLKDHTCETVRSKFADTFDGKMFFI